MYQRDFRPESNVPHLTLNPSTKFVNMNTLNFYNGFVNTSAVGKLFKTEAPEDLGEKVARWKAEAERGEEPRHLGIHLVKRGFVDGRPHDTLSSAFFVDGIADSNSEYRWTNAGVGSNAWEPQHD